MAQYIINGNTVKTIPDGSMTIVSKLPADMYFVKFNPDNHQFYLERGEKFSKETKVFGNLESRTNKIISTYLDRMKKGVNTGVLLSGIKGSGKTFQGKAISTKLIEEHNIPTIIISETHNSSGLSLFLKDISDPCCIFFEEFEKLYTSSVHENHNEDNQEGLLTLLDGVMNSNNLFIFTCNDTSDLNGLLLNRPGRIWYHFKYRGLEDSVIEAYCKEKLNNPTLIEEVKQVSDFLNEYFTFDIMKCIVEEVSRYGISVKEAISDLNIDARSCNMLYTYTVEFINNDSKNPKMIGGEKYIEMRNPLESGEEAYITFYMQTKQEAIKVDELIGKELGREFSEALHRFNENNGKCSAWKWSFELNKDCLVKSSKKELIFEKHGLRFILTKYEHNGWETYLKAF